MSWTVEANTLIEGGATDDVGRRVFKYIHDRLFNAGWTLLAYGSGSVFAKDSSGFAVNPLTSYPDISDISPGCWSVFANAEGAQILFRCESPSSRNIRAWATQTEDYLAESLGPWDDASATARPGTTNPPSDEIFRDASMTWGITSDFYLTFAESNDGLSFQVFGQRGTATNTSHWLYFGRCLHTKDGDIYPYALAHNSVSVFLRSVMTGSYAFHAYHPVGGNLAYRVAEIYAGSGFRMNVLPQDPYTHRQRLVECMLACVDSPNQHLRGVLPGILSCSSRLSTGTLINDGEYVVLHDYAFPWDKTNKSIIL